MCVCVHGCACICLSACLSVCLAVCLSVSLSLYLCVRLFSWISVCRSVSLLDCQSVCTAKVQTSQDNARLEYTAHRNTLQHAATYCITLQDTATHCKQLQSYKVAVHASHDNTLQHYCNTNESCHVRRFATCEAVMPFL